jgi:hypothetical protein
LREIGLARSHVLEWASEAAAGSLVQPVVMLVISKPLA